MTKRDVFSVAVRIVGIWAVVMGLISIPSILLAIPGLPKSFYTDQSKLIVSLAFLVPTLLIPAGAVLLLFSDNVSSRVIMNDVSFSLPGWLNDKKEVFQFAIMITGLVLLTTNLPNLIYAIFTVFHSMASEGLRLGNASEISFAHIQAFQSTIGVAIGAYLLFCKRSAGIFLRGEKRNDK